jgi:hypothetical protein
MIFASPKASPKKSWLNGSGSRAKRYQNGNAEKFTDVYNLSLLAKALGVSVDELVGASDGNPHVHVDLSHGSSDYEKSTNYLKKLLMKAKTTTNSAEAKKIRKTLLTLGGIGLALGITLLLAGFIGFASGGFEAVQHFEMFNPIPFMIMFLIGGIITGISFMPSMAACRLSSPE